MKRTMYVIISVLVLSLSMPGAALAKESKEEKDLQKEAAVIDTTAGKAQGEKAVTQRLEKDFNVSGAQIQGLRDQKQGYGEIAIVLSLCKKMPGGATDANIQQVMSMRRGPPTMGWGEVAKKLGTKLGPAISQVKKVHKEVNAEMKHKAGGDKGQKEQHGEMHKGSMGNKNMGNGQGMAPGKGK